MAEHTNTCGPGVPRENPLCYETNNYSPSLQQYFTRPLTVVPALTEQLDAAANAGFTLVGLDLGSVYDYLARGQSLEQLSGELASRGLGCLHVANLAITEDRRGVLGEAVELLDIITTLGPDFLQCSVHVAGLGEPVGRTFRELEALLEGHPCELAVEFLPFSPLRDIQGIREIIAAADLRRTRILVDSWHFCAAGAAWQELANLHSNEIAFLQFSDHGKVQGGDLLSETVNRRVMPGEGVLPLGRFCDVLREAGYKGPVSMEVLSDEWRQHPPDVYALRELEACRQFWPGQGNTPRDEI